MKSDRTLPDPHGRLAGSERDKCLGRRLVEEDVQLVCAQDVRDHLARFGECRTQLGLLDRQQAFERVQEPIAG